MATEDFQAFVPGSSELVCNVREGARDELKCKICSYIMDKPQLLGCCGQHLCDNCVTQIKQSRIAGGRCCPFCKVPNFTHMLNKGLERDVNLLRVYCPNSASGSASGCEWQGRLNQVATHLAGGGQDECQFQKVKCKNVNCNSFLPRNKMFVHENEYCKYRQYKCKYCLDFEATYEVVSTQHFPKCPEFPVACPNKCDDHSVPRSSLQKHLSEECPLQLVPCDYQSAGCNLVRPRKDMKKHYDTYQNYHNQLLAKQNASQQTLLDQMTKRLESMEYFMRQQETLLRQQEALLRQQDSKYSALLDEQGKKHEEEVCSLKNRLSGVESKANHASSEVNQVSGVVRRSSVASDELAAKVVTVEDRLASKTKQMEKDLNGIKTEIFLLKDGQSQTIKLINNTSADQDKLERVSGELKQLSLAVADMSTAGMEAMVVEQLAPTLATLEDLRDSVKGNERAVIQVTQDVQYVEKCMTPQPPFPFTVSRFKERKFNKEVFVSPPFYTHPRGYKMCVRVDLYGMNNHIAVHCCIMRGEHDEMLVWPFRGDVHISIENQLGPHGCYEKVIIYDDTTGANKAGRVTIGDKNYLHGLNQFISHQELGLDAGKNCQYLKGDALDFIVVKVDVKSL